MINLIYILITSNILTAALALYLRLKKQKPTKERESAELQEFLMDLMAGDALIRVTRVSPADVLLRSRNR